MTSTLWYPSIGSKDAPGESPAKRKRGRPKKEETNMTPTTNSNSEVKHSPITRKVFDLASFDEVNLTKPFNPPAKPASVQEALSLVNNDSEKLLNLIYEGLTSEAREAQRLDPAGFVIEDEEGKETPYTGKFADETKIKLIQGAVLNTAKMFAGGAWDTLKLEQKKGFKAQAIAMLRATPAALASLTGVKAEDVASEASA